MGMFDSDNTRVDIDSYSKRNEPRLNPVKEGLNAANEFVFPHASKNPLSPTAYIEDINEWFAPAGQMAIDEYGGKENYPWWQYGLAMAPVLGKWGKGVAKGTRIGKSERNVQKAINKENEPIVRFHRTHVGNVPSIEKEGLKLNNSNYGRNTFDSDKIPPLNWLSAKPDEIPVLRSKLENNPNEVALFKVEMPREFYKSKDRFKYENGRGSNPVKIKKGSDESSIGREGEYIIDTFAGDIPPEMLTNISDDVKNQIRNKQKKLNWWYFQPEENFVKNKKLPKRLRNLGYISSEDDIPITYWDEVYKYQIPYTEKIPKLDTKKGVYEGRTDFQPALHYLRQNTGSIERGMFVSREDKLDRAELLTNYLLKKKNLPASEDLKSATKGAILMSPYDKMNEFIAKHTK